ncbi:hypothetical protein [Psittacicella hinzii]|nr:hypothetical protein [Psittacicella hinzii]
MIILMGFLGITQYQAQKRDYELFTLTQQNAVYLEQLRQEQEAAKEMREKIYEMQQRIQILAQEKNDLNNQFHNALLAISNDLQKDQCAVQPISDSLLKWLSSTNPTSSTASTANK